MSAEVSKKSRGQVNEMRDEDTIEGKSNIERQTNRRESELGMRAEERTQIARVSKRQKKVKEKDLSRTETPRSRTKERPVTSIDIYSRWAKHQKKKYRRSGVS